MKTRKALNKLIILLIISFNIGFSQTPKGEELMGLFNIPTTDISNIANPVLGSVFYNSTTEKVMVFTNSFGWVPIASEKNDLEFNTVTGVLKLNDPKTAGNQVNLRNYVRIAPVKQITSAYTLVLEDSGSILYVNAATDITLTLPSGLPVGFNVSVYQYGNGKITFVGSGATVNHRLGRTKTAGKYAGVGIVSYKANEFDLTGDLRR